MKLLIRALVAFVLAASVHVAHAQLRPEVGKPLQQASEFLKSGRAKEALAKVREADAVANKEALESRLRDAAAQPVQPEVHLRPNKLAEYKDVAAVLASAQRLGVTKLGLVGNEQFVR